MTQTKDAEGRLIAVMRSARMAAAEDPEELTIGGPDRLMAAAEAGKDLPQISEDLGAVKVHQALYDLADIARRRGKTDLARDLRAIRRAHIVMAGDKLRRFWLLKASRSKSLDDLAVWLSRKYAGGEDYSHLLTPQNLDVNGRAAEADRYAPGIALSGHRRLEALRETIGEDAAEGALRALRLIDCSAKKALVRIQSGRERVSFRTVEWDQYAELAENAIVHALNPKRYAPDEYMQMMSGPAIRAAVSGRKG